MNKTMCVLAAACGLAMGLTTTGCKSSREVAGTVRERSVRDFQFQLDQMPARLDGMIKTMSELGSGTNPNRAATLAQFSQQLDALQGDARTLADASDQAKADSQRYFREWVRETRTIPEGAEKDAALAQLNKGSTRFDIANRYLQEGTRNFRELNGALENIRTKLTADLNSFTTPEFGRQFAAATDAATATRARIDRLDDLINSALTGK